MDDDKGRGEIAVESRSDCRMIARLAKMGCISPERASGLVEKLVEFAENASAENNPRRLEASMKSIIELLKISQKEDLASTPPVNPGSIHLHGHVHGSENNTEGTDVFTIAQSLGINLSVDGAGEKPGDIVTVPKSSSERK